MLTHVIARTLVIREDGKVLLLVRSDDDTYRPGGYDLPGGKVDDGEDYATGAAREVKEEANLAIDPLCLRLAYANTKAAFNADAGERLSMVWLGFVAIRPADAIVHLSHEHKDHRWVTIDEAIGIIADSENQQAFLRHLKDNEILAGIW